jgi:hypothetical protein
MEEVGGSIPCRHNQILSLSSVVSTPAQPYLPTTMPLDQQQCYWVAGTYSRRSITRMTRSSYSRARNSRLPYPTPTEIVVRADAEGQEWYHDPVYDLHLRDFVWYTRMQTARCMIDRESRVSNVDRVLNRLIQEGTFDRREPDVPVTMEFAMAHSSAMVQRLLMRIESLESEVSAMVLGCCCETD